LHTRTTLFFQKSITLYVYLRLLLGPDLQEG
jgi:hypothetical protein